LYNLSPDDYTTTAAVETPAAANTESVATTTEAEEGPGDSLLSGGGSALEYLYNATDNNKNFKKVVNFLGTMAEAESFKGKQTYSLSSSASGIFHFLVGNGGGHNKAGQKEDLGQYDAKGILRTSSFETAKKRLRSMMGSAKYADSIAKQPGLIAELDTVLKARTPDDLSPQRQAILAYANLKMQSSDFSNFLQGKQSAEAVYGNAWVTRGSTHSDGAIKSNWQNAIKRSVAKKSNYDFFGLTPISGFGDTEATPHPYGAAIPTMHSGGSLDQRVLAKKTLI
jgi:hypothetical protein